MGGTIEFFDPAYDVTLIKKLMKLDVSIEGYLNNIIKPHFNFTTETVTQKDSREITEKDRENLLHAITKNSQQNFIVTHGTFTMRQTAEFLNGHLPKDKKIILTGSMIPIAGFSSSDAGFNLGFAVASFASIEPGVYLSMNGGIFKSDEVQKNKDIFRFE